MLKLVTLKKLKEDYPDINIRMVLPGGLDVNRVSLPIILSSSQSPDQNMSPTIAPDKTKKSKTTGFLGLFKSSSLEPQEPNNIKGIFRQG